MLSSFLATIIIIAIWDTIWKLISMWYAAKNDSKVWFVVLSIFNTVGILPMLYLVFKTDFFSNSVKVKKKNNKKK